MKVVSGEVLETSSYTLMQHGISVIPEVRIKGDDGTLYAVRKVAVDARLANALNPSRRGVFHFQKIPLGNNCLVAAEFGGVVEFLAFNTFAVVLQALLFILIGIPTTLFFGLGILLILHGLAILYATSQIIGLKGRLAATGRPVQRFKAI